MIARVRAPLAGAMLVAALAGRSLRAQSYTLADILSSLQRAAARVDFARTDSAANFKLDSLARLLRDARVESLTLNELTAIIEGHPDNLRTVARWDRARYAEWGQPWLASALVGVRQIANTPLARALSGSLPRASVDSLLAPMDALGTRILQAGQANNLEKLRRYEIKYGPDAPRVNALEVALNYVAQFVPPFAPRSDGPSPFEIVASYSTADLTASKSGSSDFAGKIVSSTQLGLRMYQFRPGWGTGGKLAQLIRPGYASAGAFLVAPRDAPLLRTWGSGARAGAYVSWGAVHVGYVGGSNQRVVFGTGLQIIPYVF